MKGHARHAMLIRICQLVLVAGCLLVQSSHAIAQEDAPADTSDGLELESMIDRLRPDAVLRVSFREKLDIDFLSRPIESRGTLTIDADGLLIRKVVEPNPTTVVMRGSRLVMRDSTGVSRMDLETTPEAAVAVSLLRLLIVGDVEELQQRYDIERLDSQTPDVWRLKLTPRRSAARKVFTKCTLEASGDELRSITLYESDNSVRVIEFEDPERLETLPKDDRELLQSLRIDVTDQ